MFAKSPTLVLDQHFTAKQYYEIKQCIRTSCDVFNRINVSWETDVSAGHLEGVSNVFGFHIHSEAPRGTIDTQTGAPLSICVPAC